MKFTKYLFIILSTALLSSCGITKYATPVFQGERCNVYVFRDSFALVWSVSIVSEKVTYAKLDDESFTTFELPVGERVIEAKWPFLSGGVDLKVPLTCESNSNYYIAFHGDADYNTRVIRGGFIDKPSADERVSSYVLVGYR